MKRIAFSGIALCLLVSSSFALDVDRGELETASGKTIEFINYVGPHTVVDTVDDIRGIGLALGRTIASGAARAGDTARYSVLHAVDPTVPVGFDADIITIGPGAGVDHIRNLRLIISGYLEGAYAYGRKDALVIATFITVYNAVHRLEMEYFKARYKSVVIAGLPPDKAGLSVRWDEWAGSSRIVIPLTGKPGSRTGTAVDTTTITDKPTIESLKKDSATGAVAERIDMVDIKEREVAADKAAIEKDKARIADEERKLAEDKAALERDKAAAAASGDGTKGGSTDTTAAASEKGPGQEASVTVSPEAKAEEAAIAAREKQIEEEKKAVSGKEAAVAEKEKDIAVERKDIGETQKDTIAAEVAAKDADAAAGTILLELMDPDRPLARLALVDLAKGSFLSLKSDINTLRTTSVADLGKAFVAVAGSSGGTGAVRLVRVEKTDFAVSKEGTVDLFPESPLWNLSKGLFAVVKEGSLWALGRFDPATLELKAKSPPISRYTFLMDTPGGLVVQAPSGAFLLLKADDLSVIREIKR